ncbi:DUF58 domain-containing protein [Siminovitchia fortis]|uniref:DUF58 domain-containing protein n=1 Tax=Siminovitchia fortis TaxID=254758 RepID=A0A443IS20_9BACI|nr:DUF58 domain-containing protein [Siminovitchia fortis]RWR10088.1 DUF58 domain-containing protein [Siminovitchia fortis]WHY80695.1 DUF58 domain-containing protein [Siminovitchia fortis]
MPAAMSKLMKVSAVFILPALAFAYAMFQGGFVSWFLFYSFLPFALYSILLFFYPVNFQAERTVFPQTYNAGDDIEVNLTLKRKLPFPLLFLLIEDVMPDSLNHEKMKRVFFPGFKRNLKMAYTIRNASRGEHHLHCIRLKTGDALGLLEKEKRILCKQAILVYPPYEDIFYKSFRSMLDQGGVLSLSSSRNDTSLVAGIREYEPGDRFSWIDWKASAKSNQMMTKEFETRESNDFLIILDTAPANNFETLVKFAASASRTVIRNGGKAGMLIGGKEKVLLPPRSGAGQEAAIFYQLAKVSEDGSHELEHDLGDQALAGQSAVFVIITSRLSKQMVDGAGKLPGKNRRVFIFLMKGNEEISTAEETALKAMAAGKGLNVHTVVGHNFRMAFAGVEQTR